MAQLLIKGTLIVTVVVKLTLFNIFKHSLDDNLAVLLKRLSVLCELAIICPGNI
jgi:hypothetical protein